ncbi:hypothetical protein J6590_082731 [Homalodisca vitripennis]|nr:hypothetical protein J6590_082731 [Homalodisca vitripennis]
MLYLMASMSPSLSENEDNSQMSDSSAEEETNGYANEVRLNSHSNLPTPENNNGHVNIEKNGGIIHT